MSNTWLRQVIAVCMLCSLPLTAAIPAKDDDAGKARKKSIAYIPLDPPFVVNFSPDSDIRFLQVSVELGTRNPEAIELIRNNRPAIRNNLVFLFSDQDAKYLETRQGKDKLRDDALNEARKVIQEEGGIDGIDTIYFTSFVMQ